MNAGLISLGRSHDRRVAPDRPEPTRRPRCGPPSPVPLRGNHLRRRNQVLRRISVSGKNFFSVLKKA
jgi:hypothetical protein